MTEQTIGKGRWSTQAGIGLFLFGVLLLISNLAQAAGDFEAQLVRDPSGNATTIHLPNRTHVPVSCEVTLAISGPSPVAKRVIHTSSIGAHSMYTLAGDLGAARVTRTQCSPITEQYESLTAALRRLNGRPAERSALTDDSTKPVPSPGTQGENSESRSPASPSFSGQ